MRALRTAGFAAPVLFLTALGGLSDKVERLRAIADDYLETPELVALVEARATAGTGLDLPPVRAVAASDGRVRATHAHPGLRIVVGFPQVPPCGALT